VALSTYIVILAEAEEAADLGGTLGAEALGVDGVGQAGDVLLALLDDRESENREVGADDAAADGLALALAGAAGAVARVAVGEEEADTAGGNDTLLHRETLLVVAAGDADNVALPLIAKGLGRDLSAHLVELARLRAIGGFRSDIRASYDDSVSLTRLEYQKEGNILVEVPQLPLILHLDELLRAVRGMRNVQLLSRVSHVVELEPHGKKELLIIEIVPFFESRGKRAFSPSCWRYLLNGRR
jgi:hypothetical protein